MADELKPAYLIAGTDRPKVDRAVARLRARFEADAVELLDAAETTGDDAVAACNALGLFGSGDRLVSSPGRGVESARREGGRRLPRRARCPARRSRSSAGELKKDAPIAKAVARTARCCCSTCRTAGSQAGSASSSSCAATPGDAEACRLLIELVGDDLYELATEVDKLATWAAGEPMTRRRSRSSSRRARSRRLRAHRRVGNARRRRRASSLRAPARAHRRPALTDDPAPRGALTSHVARIRTCQSLDAEGVDLEGRRGALKLHPYYVQKLYAQARNYSEGELRDATVRLAELDHALKGGSRLAGDLELERALIEITQR